MIKTQWKIYQHNDIPPWFYQQVNNLSNTNKSDSLTKLLWGRGFDNAQQLKWFLDTNNYKYPCFISEFGNEIKQALIRLQKASTQREKVVIWGGYNIDGVTATCVLWEGLKPFFPLENQLIYHFYHGLTCEGINALQQQGVNVIITADMGSNNAMEIDYANGLGVDIIIIDHHSLPDHRPEVISFLNPLNFAKNHAFYHLSGVAIAYKLLEGLYQQFPSITSQPITNLLDLVAIGLLADDTPLKGYCRYLAQQGIKILQQNKRLGIEKLIQLCKKNGDRPMDISLGISQRIKAINYISDDNNVTFQLLTENNNNLVSNLAKKAEKSYFNTKDLQIRIVKQIEQKINNLDISNNGVIILTDNQWEIKILPLIINIISQKYYRPVILLVNDDKSMIAKGYGTSINNINLGELLVNKKTLLHSLNSYHNIIELSLPIENINLLRDDINQQLRNKINIDFLQPTIHVDLVVTVAELGKKLRHELRLIEPCSVDNPHPKLLIKNCWFKNIKHKNQSYKNKIDEEKEGEYIQTSFTIYDKSSENKGFKGIWLGHYANEINSNKNYDVVVELDYDFVDKYSQCVDEEYYIRIIDLKLNEENVSYHTTTKSTSVIIDYRYQNNILAQNNNQDILLKKCPFQWQEISQNYGHAIEKNKNLALVYHHDKEIDVEQLWQKFISIIKDLLKENKTINTQVILTEIHLSELALNYILDSLEKLGITYEKKEDDLSFKQIFSTFSSEIYHQVKKNFEDIIKEENLQKSYFYEIPVSIIKDEITSNYIEK